jgi:hypothetical protein
MWTQMSIEQLTHDDTRLMRFRTLIQTRGLIAHRLKEFMIENVTRLEKAGKALASDQQALGACIGENQMLASLAVDFNNLFPFADGMRVPVDMEMLAQFENETGVAILPASIAQKKETDDWNREREASGV